MSPISNNGELNLNRHYQIFVFAMRFPFKKDCDYWTKWLTSLVFRKRSVQAAVPNPVRALTMFVWCCSCLRHWENTESAVARMWSLRRLRSPLRPNSTILSSEIICKNNSYYIDYHSKFSIIYYRFMNKCFIW